MFTGWACIICQTRVIFNPEKTFSDQEKTFSDHIQSKHGDIVAEKHWRQLLIASQLYDEPDLKKCPVCSIDETAWISQKAGHINFDPGTTSFLEHVGKCMHDLALRVMPSREPDGALKDASGGLTGISHISTRSSLDSVSLIISVGDTQLDLQKLPSQLIDNEKKVKDWQSTMESVQSNIVSSKTLSGLQGPTIDVVDGHELQVSESYSESSEGDETPEQSFRRSLSNAKKMSAFEKTHSYFFPEGVLSGLITVKTIRDVLNIANPTPAEDELIDFIKMRAQKAFAIALWAKVKNPKKMMAYFKSNKLDDNDLPITDPKSPMSKRSWFDDVTEHQWKFYAATLLTAKYDQVLQESCILPFMSKVGDDVRGSFGSVSKYLVHRNHMEPVRRLILRMSLHEIC